MCKFSGLSDTNLSVWVHNSKYRSDAMPFGWHRFPKRRLPVWQGQRLTSARKPSFISKFNVNEGNCVQINGKVRMTSFYLKFSLDFHFFIQNNCRFDFWICFPRYLLKNRQLKYRDLLTWYQVAFHCKTHQANSESFCVELTLKYIYRVNRISYHIRIVIN